MIKISLGDELLLRTAKEEDAKNIFDMRVEAFENTPDYSLDKQQKYMIEYKNIEPEMIDFYFMIEYQNNLIGTVRLHDIDYDKKTFNWGSLIVKANNFPYLVLRIIYTIYHFGFNYLLLNTGFFRASKYAKSLINFHHQYAQHISTDNLHNYFQIESENFDKFIEKYKSFLPNSLIEQITVEKD